MRVRDNGPVDRAPGVYEKVTGRTVDAMLSYLEHVVLYHFIVRASYKIWNRIVNSLRIYVDPVV
jgi:hypothetical protein